MLRQHLDLVPQRFAVDVQAVGQVHPHLPLQGQVVQILRDGHVDRELHRIPPAFHQLEWRGRCHRRAAVLAPILLPTVLPHHEVSLHHRNFLGVLALPFPLGQCCAAVGTHAVGLGQFVRMLLNGKFGLLARPVSGLWRTWLG